MPNNQHSSVLNEQELQLLVSAEKPKYSTLFPLYSMVEYRTFVELNCNTIIDIAAIVLQLSASPLGSGVILTNAIEASVHSERLLKVLKKRADIKVFWVGSLPSMAFDLPSFTYCHSHEQLEIRVKSWESNNLILFNAWQRSYKVGIITELNSTSEPLVLNHLSSIKTYNAHQAIQDIKDLQLLIINLNTPKLRLVEILNNLSADNQTPFLFLYGDMQANLSHAIYNLVNNLGFSILASFNSEPSPTQSKKILVTLFSKIYLKHWINTPAVNLSAKAIYNLYTNKVESLFYPYGLNQEQIINIPCPTSTRKIVNIQSVFDWYPDGIKRDDVSDLIKLLGCEPDTFDLYINNPHQISVTSPIFTFLVMARLNKFKVYWTVDNEKDFSIDILMYLPISDVILSQSLANQLLNQPSLGLLDFLEEIQSQKIRLCATMEHNPASINALSLYGVEVLLGEIEISDC